MAGFVLVLATPKGLTLVPLGIQKKLDMRQTIEIEVVKEGIFYFISFWFSNLEFVQVSLFVEDIVFRFF